MSFTLFINICVRVTWLDSNLSLEVELPELDSIGVTAARTGTRSGGYNATYGREFITRTRSYFVKYSIFSEEMEEALSGFVINFTF